jgi:hypothetical protein
MNVETQFLVVQSICVKVVSKSIYNITAQHHSRMLLAGIQRRYQHQTSKASLDARLKRSGMTEL